MRTEYVDSVGKLHSESGWWGGDGSYFMADKASDFDGWVIIGTRFYKPGVYIVSIKRPVGFSGDMEFLNVYTPKAVITELQSKLIDSSEPSSD